MNGKLWAVEDSVNNHGNGQLIPTTGQTVHIEGKPIIVHGPDHAQPDDLCPVEPEHCDPETAQGSPDVFSY